MIGSQRYREVVLGSYTSTAKVDIEYDGEKIFSTQGRDDVGIDDGSVSITRDADVRRRLKLQVSFFDTSIYDQYFNPAARHIIKPYRGVVYEDGEVEWIPLGVFKFHDYDVVSRGDRSNGMYANFNGLDLSYFLNANVWQSPWSISDGTNVITAITDILDDREIGFTSKRFVESTSETTAAMFVTDPPWRQIRRMGESIGFEPYYDALGIFTCRQIGDPLDRDLDLDLTALTNGVRIGELNRSGDITETYSGVIINASAPWLLYPIQATYWDDDVSSPTYRGRIGEIPKIINDSTITNQTQADDAVEREWNRIRGRVEQIAFDSIVIPTLEGGNIVGATDSDTGVVTKHTLETYNIPLLKGLSSGTVRTLTRRPTDA